MDQTTAAKGARGNVKASTLQVRPNPSVVSPSLSHKSDRRALLSVRQQGGIGKAAPLRDALGKLLNGCMAVVLRGPT